MGKPIAVNTTGKAPQSGESLPTVKATGKAGTSIKPDGKAGIGQGLTICQHTATKQGTGKRRKSSRFRIFLV